jgi:hypothetical protein
VEPVLKELHRLKTLVFERAKRHIAFFDPSKHYVENYVEAMKVVIMGSRKGEGNAEGNAVNAGDAPPLPPGNELRQYMLGNVTLAKLNGKFPRPYLPRTSQWNHILAEILTKSRQPSCRNSFPS